ncbi:hypothetical protein GQ457_07G005740 [Hibiscus cannabinus]
MLVRSICPEKSDLKLEEAIEDTKLEQRRWTKGIYRGYLLDVIDIFRRLVQKYFCVHKALFDLVWYLKPFVCSKDRHLSDPVQIASFRNVGLTLTLVSNGGGIEMHFLVEFNILVKTSVYNIWLINFKDMTLVANSDIAYRLV